MGLGGGDCVRQINDSSWSKMGMRRGKRRGGRSGEGEGEGLLYACNYIESMS